MTGWARLEVHSSPEVPDVVAATAAGVIEGKLTALRMYQTLVNFGLGPDYTPTSAIRDFMSVQSEWIAGMKAMANKSTAADKAYWHQVGRAAEHRPETRELTALPRSRRPPGGPPLCAAEGPAHGLHAGGGRGGRRPAGAQSRDDRPDELRRASLGWKSPRRAGAQRERALAVVSDRHLDQLCCSWSAGRAAQA